jgi:Acetyltransferase (GNAT) domain
VSRYRLALLDAESPRAGAYWRELEEAAAPPYFLSWGFLKSWLACLAPEHRPELAVWFRRERPVAASLLGRVRVRRHGFVTSRERLLNGSGLARFDEVTIEHNQLLRADGDDWSLAELVEALPEDWDEIVLPALACEAFPGCKLGEPLDDHVIRIERRAPAPFVDLALVRAAPEGYASLLGSNTRAQIRRARRGLGPIEVELARDEAQALEIFDELERLHQRSWQARRLPGAFADPWFSEFHRHLIHARMRHGEVQLLRVRARGKTIGCLYNLVSRGRVLFYQSGFAPFDDPRLKPGYVCHAEAVELNARAGHDLYDLLGGDARYKRSLATGETWLVWARVQRPLARFRAEERLRRWKRALTAAVHGT